jgi:hypothetical protein
LNTALLIEWLRHHNCQQGFIKQKTSDLFDHLQNSAVYFSIAQLDPLAIVAQTQ